MRKRKCLGFLGLVFVLVVSMFSNVFASSNEGWTCIYEKDSPYSIGDTIKSVTGIDIRAENDTTTIVEFQSDFEVKSGDVIELDLETYLCGSKYFFDQASSAGYAAVIAENGETICSVTCNIYGEIHPTSYESNRAIVTDETEGTLTFHLLMEGTGTKEVDACMEQLYLEVNDNEV